jgi:succinate dehydrogenase/fumarate reductase flavoprotein subunit
LDKETGLDPGSTKAQLVGAMEGHILAEGQLMGQYRRQRGTEEKGGFSSNMRGMPNHERFSCDVLVIGGGGGGLRAAIEAREHGADVLVVSKVRVGYGNNTYISKATIAAPGQGSTADDQDVLVEDTVVGGRFLNDQKLVGLMARKAGAQISFLEKCGVSFSKEEGNIRLYHVPGHRNPRHVRAAHPTGRDLMVPLTDYAKRVGVRFADRVFVTKLFARGDRIAGASGVSEDGSFRVFVANCVVLATGGYSHIYLNTNNTPGITGDGQALAFDLGLPLKDIEFVQFYPTALGTRGSRILLYEAFVFLGGAVLKNAKGENILTKHHLNDPLVMTRDRLARVIMLEIQEGLDVEGGVVMDLSALSEDRMAQLRPLFPSLTITDKKQFIVAPTTHFCMGGVVTDQRGETSVKGLFAAGEVCGGLHGANRLGGNALAEVFTMGGIAGRDAAMKAREMGRPEILEHEIAEEKSRLVIPACPGGQDSKSLCRALKEVMWYHAGIIRGRRSLEQVLEKIEELNSENHRLSIAKPKDLVRYLELQHMLLISEMLCGAALLRTESRGAHYRKDYPEEDNANWLKNIIVRKQDNKMRFETVPVALEKVMPDIKESLT